MFLSKYLFLIWQITRLFLAFYLPFPSAFLVCQQNFFHSKSFKEQSLNFYIKNTFQCAVVLHIKILCRQVNVPMLSFVPSSVSHFSCLVKLLLSFVFCLTCKKNLFWLLGTQGCYHVLRLNVVFHTTSIIPPHIYVHPTLTSLS